MKVSLVGNLEKFFLSPFLWSLSVSLALSLSLYFSVSCTKPFLVEKKVSSSIKSCHRENLFHRFIIVINHNHNVYSDKMKKNDLWRIVQQTMATNTSEGSVGMGNEEKFSWLCWQETNFLVETHFKLFDSGERQRAD